MRPVLSLLPFAALALACASAPQSRTEAAGANAPALVEGPRGDAAAQLPATPLARVADDSTGVLRVQRPAYTFPVPSGWQEVVHPSVADLNAAGGAIITRPAAGKGWFTPSVVVAPVPAGALPTHGVEDCRAIADAVAEITQTHVDRADLLNLPSAGKSCQFDLTSSVNEHRRGRGTVLVGESPWTMTCNYDARDTDALPACDAVVQGFRFIGEPT